MIKYSIIIPTHNRSKLILKLLSKALRVEDSQIVLVENGSTKEEKLKYYEIINNLDSDKLVYSSNKWGNLQKARETGFNLAEGEYIWQIDDDDMITEEFIDFLNSFEPTKGLYRFPYSRYGNKIFPNRGKVNKPSKLFHSMEVSTFLFKREMIAINIFRESVAMFEDQLFGKFIYDLFSETEFINVNSIIYDPYAIEESMTRSKRNLTKDSEVLNYLDSSKENDLVIYKKVFLYQYMDSMKGIYDTTEMKRFYNDPSRKSRLKEKTGLILLDLRVKKAFKKIMKNS